MYRLGYIYERGIGKSINIDSAIYWYRKSSNLGQSQASSAIGTLFLDGGYIKENSDSGMLWFNKAIIQNAASGYMDLGEIYEKGMVVEADLELAIKYYLKADSVAQQLQSMQ
ncbi:MAG: sel1 repeat family protein [Cyclobacteriaceae bacterium]|nr:MAG: sel1 repeat family protein [Cyclobacteriaceae bacterium]